jgi:Beta-eliminating lyase
LSARFSNGIATRYEARQLRQQRRGGRRKPVSVPSVSTISYAANQKGLGVVHLFSDGCSRPTPEMHQAMANAEVGDDVTAMIQDVVVFTKSLSVGKDLITFDARRRDSR